MKQNTERTGGELLVSALAQHGVDTVFGIPGTHNLAVFAAMPKHGIRNITTRHEQGAGYAADGFARSSGQVGVVVTTTGPAALNAAAALGQAYSDSIPVLLIAPGMPTGHPSHGNGLLHELRDQRGSFDGIVSQSHRVESLAEIPLAVAQAFARMQSGRPRAEYLEIPLDLLDAQGTVDDIPVIPPAATVCADNQTLSAAAERLNSADRVLMIVGGGASAASAEVKQVAEALGALVVSTTNGKGTFPEGHELALGTGLHQPSMNEVMRSVGAVLAVGTEFAPSDWWLGIPQLPETFVRIDIDPAGVLANANPSHPLIGDAAHTLSQLLNELDSSNETDQDGAERPALPDWITDAKKAVRADNDELGASWLEAMQSLNLALPEGAVIAADNAMAAYYGAFGTLTLDRSRAFMFPTGVGTLGFGLPAGIGAKIADPETPVVVIQGDGGVMFTIQELATAADCKLALPIVIFDNGGYGEIRNEMADRDDPIHSVALGSTDFVALALALGCEGTLLEDPAQLGEAVTEAFTRNRPTVIVIREKSRAAEDLLA